MLSDENKNHLSATEKKDICSRDLLNAGYLLSGILIDVSESALKYFQKLQFYVFSNKSQQDVNKQTNQQLSPLPPTPLTNQNLWKTKQNLKKTHQKIKKEGKKKKEKEKRPNISKSISSHK